MATNKKSAKDNNTYLVPALTKGLQILEMFSRHKRVLTINEIAEYLGVSVSSIYRTVVTLTELNYLNKLERNRYELGPMVLSNGFVYLASRELVQIAAPYLLELRDKSSSSCHLVIRDGLQAVYLYREPSPQKLSVNVPIGSRFPCHSVAAGRSLLTGLTGQQLSDLFAGVALDRYPPPAPNSLPMLRQILEEDRQNGFSINQSDFATAIAVPVINFAGQVVAAVNVSAPDTLMQDDYVRERMTELVLQSAQKITNELGGNDRMTA